VKPKVKKMMKKVKKMIKNFDSQNI